jgi:gas vesicle protein
MSIQKILIGTLAGTLAGLAIGLLVAPASGMETRERIADSAETLRKKLRRIRNSADSELEELSEVFEHEVKGLKDDVRQKILKLIETSKKGYNNVRDEATSN